MDELKVGIRDSLHNELKKHNIDNGEAIFLVILKIQDNKLMEYEAKITSKSHNKMIWKENISKKQEIYYGR